MASSKMSICKAYEEFQDIVTARGDSHLRLEKRFKLSPLPPSTKKSKDNVEVILNDGKFLYPKEEIMRVLKIWRSFMK